MKVARELNVHICSACKAPVEDGDFLRCGVSVVNKPQFFFEYRCPRCSHLGRHVLDIHDRLGVPQALCALAEFVTDDADNRKALDWNAIKWD